MEACLICGHKLNQTNIDDRGAGAFCDVEYECPHCDTNHHLHLSYICQSYEVETRKMSAFPPGGEEITDEN